MHKLLLTFGILIFCGLQWKLKAINQTCSQGETELTVQFDRDCSSIEEEGIYILYVAIFSGHPPFMININGIEDTLQDFGFMGYPLTDGASYEVTVNDSNGQESFQAGGEIACSKEWDLCNYDYYSIGYKSTCIENEKIIVEINSDYLDAYYIDKFGRKYTLDSVDTIPNMSYLVIRAYNNYIVDTLLNCLSANDDFVIIKEGEALSFNVLDNDFGQNIQVVDIIEIPQCGELLDWATDGKMTYRMGEGCIEDEISYELENDLGEKAVASVRFQKDTEQEEEEMYLDWELECTDYFICELYVKIEKGTPPYTIDGYYNAIIEENEFFLHLDCYDDVVFEVSDSIGQIAAFKMKDIEHFCGGGDCYEPLFAYQYLEIEYLEEQGGVVHYLDRMQSVLIERAFWIDSNNKYHELKEFDTIPNNSYYYLELQFFGHIDGYVNCKTADIAAVDDFANTLPSEPVTINVLSNDLGDGLRLSSFPVMPSCGEIADWQEDGTIVYIADANTHCTVDAFLYVIEDNWGEKDTATVTVFIEQFPLDLIVQVDRDCSNIFVEDTYVVDILFTGGTPPYKVNVNGEESIFEEPGFISYTICRYDGYEVTVTDSSGQDYYEISELPCFWWFSICGEKPDFDYEITCLGNGKVGIEMDSSFVSAHYTDNQGNEHELNPIDTIPNLSYLNIQVSDCASIDTLLNCLSANNDFIEVLEGNTISFNVLENDFGQEIKVSAILEMPQCAGIFEWDIDGSLVYKMMEGETCVEDEIVYELENSLGEKTTANVYLQKIEYQQMYLDWESICDDSDCDFLFTIVGGLPPYYIFAYYVSGTYNDIIEGDEFTIPTIGCAEKIELEIIDSGGEIFVFELNTYPLCYSEDCYEPGFVEDFVQLECLGELGTTMKFQNEMQLALLERFFWIDSNNQYHELKEFDTIPNNSYYYLELQYFGHIDGYVDCLMTDIEGVEENAENISLQLFPNPNNGQFSLQLNTPPTFSLQSFPTRIYDIAGRLIESHEIQGNSLETLDLENVQSGLYLLQVVLKDRVLTERFLVE